MAGSPSPAPHRDHSVLNTILTDESQTSALNGNPVSAVTHNLGSLPGVCAACAILLARIT